MVIRFLAATITVICLLSLSASVVSSGAPCEKADNLNWIAGNNMCLVMKTFMPSNKVEKPILRVFLHGDSSRGRPSDYMYRQAARHAPGVVSVAIIRPDHRDSEGRQSTPKSYGRPGWETEESIDAITDAVRKLKKHHNASKVVMIGHSGGCNIAAVMLGRHPGVADAALLLGCACDKETKRLMQGRRYREEDVNPLDYVDYVPLTTKIIAVTGSHDSTNPVEICRPYIGYLKERGVSARLDIAEGAKHSFRYLRRSMEYDNGLKELTKQ